MDQGAVGFHFFVMRTGEARATINRRASYPPPSHISQNAGRSSPLSGSIASSYMSNVEEELLQGDVSTACAPLAASEAAASTYTSSCEEDRKLGAEAEGGQQFSFACAL